MPSFAIVVDDVDVENVATISGTEETKWHVTLKDTVGTETRKVWISSDEDIEIEGSRGTANFVMKWKESKRQCNVTLTAIETWNSDSNDDPLAVFECRNCEIVDWHPADGFAVTSSEGTEFEDVDLSDDWADYDEEADCSVSISNLAWKIEKVASDKKGKKGRRRKK